MFVFCRLYIFVAALGLSLFATSGDYPSVAVLRLIVMASLVAEHRRWSARTSMVAAHGLSSCGAQAELLHGVGDLPGPRIEPMFPALTGRCFTPGTPGMSHKDFFKPKSFLFHLGLLTCPAGV